MTIEDIIKQYPGIDNAMESGITIHQVSEDGNSCIMLSEGDFEEDKGDVYEYQHPEEEYGYGVNNGFVIEGLSLARFLVFESADKLAEHLNRNNGKFDFSDQDEIQVTRYLMYSGQYGDDYDVYAPKFFESEEEAKIAAEIELSDNFNYVADNSKFAFVGKYDITNQNLLSNTMYMMKDGKMEETNIAEFEKPFKEENNKSWSVCISKDPRNFDTQYDLYFDSEEEAKNYVLDHLNENEFALVGLYDKEKDDYENDKLYEIKNDELVEVISESLNDEYDDEEFEAEENNKEDKLDIIIGLLKDIVSKLNE